MMKQSISITMSRVLLERLRTVASTQKRSLSQHLELIAERHFARCQSRRPRPAHPPSPVPAPSGASVPPTSPPAQDAAPPATPSQKGAPDV